MRDWEPGKNSFIGHSMGGQTIRQMEEFLRNGNQEEIEYQRQHGVLYPIYLQVVKIIWLLQLLHLAHHIMVHLLQIKLAHVNL